MEEEREGERGRWRGSMGGALGQSESELSQGLAVAAVFASRVFRFKSWGFPIKSHSQMTCAHSTSV